MKSIVTILRRVVRKFRNLSLYRLKKRGLQIGDNFQYEKNLLIDKIYPLLDSAKRVPIYSMDLDPLRMKEVEKREQKEELQFSFGIKKAVNYYKFNSLEK